MCLAVPAKIVALQASTATVDMHGNRLDISTLLIDSPALNDWVLVHAGFAIQKIDPATAEETFSLLADLHTASQNALTPGP